MTLPGRLSRLGAVIVSGLLVAACSASSGKEPSQAPPLSMSEYGPALTRAVKPLDSALKNLAKADAYKGLEDRVTAVETAAGQAATGLGQITPPAELAQAHSQFAAALETFRDELGDVGSQVDDRALCTGSAVRVDVGKADGTSGLRAALGTLSAKLPAPKPTLTLPSAGLQDGSRPPNGKLIRASHLNGQGELVIDNGGSTDAVVTLTKGKKSTAAVYVRKGKKYTVTGVPDGTYTLFFSGGAGWDGDVRAFGRKCAFQRFEDPLSFHTTRIGNQAFGDRWSITLQRVVGGNARTADVDPDDIPR